MRNPFIFEPEAVTSQEIMNAEEEEIRRRRPPIMRRRPVRPRPRFPSPSWPFALPYPWPVPPQQEPSAEPSATGGNSSEPAARAGADAEPLVCSCPVCSPPLPTASGAEPSAGLLPDDAAQEFWFSGEDEAFSDEFYQLTGPESEDPLEGFIGAEHRDIGDLAVGQEKTIIAYGESGQRLSFGEVVALAGDYFGTYEQMRDLARTREGRAQIAWARWDALSLPKSSEPNVPAKVKETVRERYYVLASNNKSHFSAGGTGKQTYTMWHSKAIAEAFQAGQRGDESMWRRALTIEAFGNHFLTDIFSAGHIRTPRQELREFYGRLFPNSTDIKAFVHYMAKFMYDDLNRRHKVPLHLRALEHILHIVTENLEKRIKKLGGEAVKSFSLGDIISLALHDLDNLGLKVVSEVDDKGNKVPGGHRWTAVGDSHLKTIKGDKTKTMVVKAVKSSLKELQRVREAGRRAAGRTISTPQRANLVKKAIGGPFAARAFVPREDLTPGANTPLPRAGRTSPLEWRWGRLGNVAYREVDKTVKGSIANDLFKRSSDIPESASGISGIRDAFLAFVAHLRRDGIRVLESAVKKKAR